MSGKTEFKKLPTHSRPINYNLTLTPNLLDFTFKGQQVVTVEITEPTNSLVLNSAELEIETAKFNDAEAEISFNEPEETVKLSFNSALPVGRGQLSLSFSGALNSRMKGFYRTVYTDSSTGAEVRCAVTQFAPTDARRCLPCWDEPELKATFDVTMLVDTDLTALSNMPEQSRSDTSSGLVSVKFQQSPIMSTYLLAFAVGRFDYVEDYDSDNVRLRVYTPSGRREQGRFALDVARKTLPFYKDFFSVAYPLPKLDLVAVPDLAFGAMENWGLVTYRETALLVDTDNSSAATKERVALIVGHELAHQWFGNLVTMQWWTHLWLNEGFASWIQYLCVDQCYPEFDIWTRFVKSDLSRALVLDALDSSHPIEVPIGSPCEIDEIFDAISYCKGASVIRMLHEWLGQEAFRDGLSRYLDRHKYSNAQTEQLWKALEEASGQPVDFVMGTWTKQMGYPLISVSAKPADNDDGQQLELSISQERFQFGSNSSLAAWRVPIQVLTAEGVKINLLLTEKSAAVRVPKAAWVKLNPGFVGVYRTLYSEEMLSDLIAALQRGQLSQRDRFNLESDLFALFSAGRLSIVQLLQVVDACKVEQFYTVWADLLDNLAATIQVLVDQLGLSQQWRSFVCQLCEPAFQRCGGWDAQPGDGHDVALLRAALIRALGLAGHPSVVAEARARFSRHCSGECAIPADLRDSVYRTVLANGGGAEFEAALDLMDKTDLQEEKDRIQRSLGSSRDPQLRQRVLQLVVSGDKVRLQDSIYVLGSVSSASLESRRATWRFIKCNWAWFQEKLRGQILLSRLVQQVCNNFCSSEDAEDIETFFQANPLPSAERNIKQALENARLNARDRIQRSLGSSRDPQLRQRVLQLVVSGDKVRLQDSIYVLGSVSSASLESRRATWRFIKCNWAWFQEKLRGQILLSRLVQQVCNNFCSSEDAEDIETFFQANPLPSAERNIKQALENARLNARVLAREGCNLENFLAKFDA
uniref:Aminopeptidase n=1 Tax=Macrostomum lignano TaxID=282301 RepID=A0A1I8JHD6_9PLAT